MTEATATEASWRDLAVIDVWTRDAAVPCAGRLLGIGRDNAYRAAATGEIPTVRIGKRVLVPVAKLRELLGESAA